MKKLIYILPLLLFAMFFCGCKGDRGPMGPAGPAGADGVGEVTYFKTIDVTIKSGDWVEENGYLSYTLENVTEITDDVFNYGMIVTYIYTDDETITQLPRVLHRSDINENGETVYWTTTFDAEISPYKVSFFASNSDFQIDDLSELKFKIVCIL